MFEPEERVLGTKQYSMRSLQWSVLSHGQKCFSVSETGCGQQPDEI
jgi:hypothetical protein